MKKILSIIAITLMNLTSFGQITTTLATTTATNGNLVTVTSTVLTTNTVLSNSNMFDFTYSAFNTNTTSPIFNKLNFGSNGPSTTTLSLTKNLQTGPFDSLSISLRATTYSALLVEVSLLSNTYTITSTSTSTNTSAWDKISTMDINKNLNNNYLLNIGITLLGNMTLSDLNVISYLTSTVVSTYTIEVDTNITGIDDSKNIDVMYVYTTSNTLKVKGNVKEGTMFSISDLTGKQVLSKTFLNNVNELNLPTSIYLVEIFNNNENLLTTKKVLIQN